MTKDSVLWAALVMASCSASTMAAPLVVDVDHLSCRRDKIRVECAQAFPYGSVQTRTDASGRCYFVDDNGTPVHVGDMRKQIDQAFRNLETVLKASGYSLANVVRLNYYTTDIDAFLSASDVVGSRLAAARSQPPGTLLGVAKLAFPGLMIEIEATAAK